MPSLANHPQGRLVKAICMADSGSGKTGSLASLVDAGYNLRILDFDGKASIIANYCKKPENLEGSSAIPLQDDFKLGVGGRVAIKKADAFNNGMKLLNKWEDDGVDYGSVESWTEKEVLVIDTLGMMGRSSLNMVLFANGYMNKPPEIQHWGTAMENVEKVVAQLCSDSIPCHVIVNCHIDLREAATGGVIKAYPDALGAKLGPKISRYFNTQITLSVRGGVRKFQLDKDGIIPCKMQKPMTEKDLPIETGWAQLFKHFTGK